MSKLRLKLLLWFILLLVSIAGCFFVISQVANLLLYFQAGADPASALNLVPNKPAELKVELNWLPDDPDTGRKMEPLTRTQIESAYLRAWLQWNISYLRGEPYGLKTYFVGPALAAVTEAVELTHLQGWSLAQTDLEHQLKLHMYSADGSIISFTARNVRVAQIIRNYNSEQILADVIEADYDVVMMLEDGNWRVRHWVRRENTDPPAKVSVPYNPALFAQVEDQQLQVDGWPFTVRGLNYYPKDTPWYDFWPAYDPEIIEHDFALMADLGLNTIRIFVPHELQPPADQTATKQTAEETTQYENLRLNLKDLLDQAAEHQLKVIVTLFDFHTDYQILLWPNANRNLEEIVPYFAEHPSILAWDLKNEPDLDQAGNTTVLVNAWLSHIAEEVRQHDPNHLITIGWSTPAQAVQLAELVDFVSFHDYEIPATLGDRITALRLAVPDKPILLTEFGLSTWNSRLFPNGHTEHEQAAYYAEVRRSLAATDVAGYIAWTLYDFADVPASVVGRSPWRTGPQHQFGLVRHNDEKKWAAYLLAEHSNLDIPKPSVFARFTKPFWQTFFMLLLTLGFLSRKILHHSDLHRI